MQSCNYCCPWLVSMPPSIHAHVAPAAPALHGTSKSPRLCSCVHHNSCHMTSTNRHSICSADSSTPAQLPAPPVPCACLNTPAAAAAAVACLTLPVTPILQPALCMCSTCGWRLTSHPPLYVHSLPAGPWQEGVLHCLFLLLNAQIQERLYHCCQQCSSYMAWATCAAPQPLPPLKLRPCCHMR